MAGVSVTLDGLEAHVQFVLHVCAIQSCHADEYNYVLQYLNLYMQLDAVPAARMDFV